MAENAFPAYLTKIMDRHGWTQADFARATGLSAIVISRWLRGEVVPNPTNARELAEKVGRPVLEVFVAAGFLTAEQAGQPGDAHLDLGTLSHGELLAEVERRMRAGETAAIADGSRTITREEAERDGMITGRVKKTAGRRRGREA